VRGPAVDVDVDVPVDGPDRIVLGDVDVDVDGKKRRPLLISIVKM
jgi:hypothetical protein